MKTTLSHKPDWSRKVTFGRESVSVYRRRTPQGNVAFMVANYSGEKRRFDCYATEGEALDAANRLARQLSQRDVLSASMTKEQSVECANAVQTLQPLDVSLTTAVSTLAEAIKLTGDLPGVVAACQFYAQRTKRITPKRVAEVVAELLSVKEKRGASVRYLQDLRLRLGHFADAFACNIGSVTTAAVQEWLDSRKVSTQSYMNARRVVFLLFGFAIARGYAVDNPIAGVESVKIRNGNVQIFTPSEVARLLASASPEFLPCIALGAFAGLRSAEIERLAWSDIDLAGGNIVVGADAAKTASRRVVPVCDTLAAWLAPYAGRQGKVWQGGHDAFYDAQQDTAKAAGVKWKANALRHSFASYSFALSNDAGRIAGYLGNSPAIVHKHYRELVKPKDGERWFNMKPETPATVMALPQAAAVTV